MLDIWKTIIEHLSWPVFALFLALLFRKPLTHLLERLNNIKAPGFELAAPQPAASSQLKEEMEESPEALKGEILPVTSKTFNQPPAGTSGDDELEKKRDAVRNFGKGIPFIDESIKAIKDHLDRLKIPLGTEETGEILVRQLAVAQQMARCERTHRMIYGSQIVALHLINNAGPQPKAALEPIFENAHSQEPDFYGSYTFDNWIGFLIKEGAVVRNDAGYYAITKYGKSYLQFIGVFATAPKAH